MCGSSRRTCVCLGPFCRPQRVQVTLCAVAGAHVIVHMSVVAGSYFSQYGRALLDPLPANAIYLAAYDIQWTVCANKLA